MSTDFFSRFKQGELAIVRDDLALNSKRAALVAPAHLVTAEKINRLITMSSALPFVALSAARAFAFRLEKMGRPRTSSPGLSNDETQSQMCISIEAREGVTTGISAHDRATTISILGEDDPNPRKLVRPGHVIPLDTRVGGVLVRAAIPEAAVDIARIAGFNEAAIILDLLGADGELMSIADVDDIARKNSIPQITIGELLEYRLSTETIIERVAEAKLPTLAAGELRAIIYRSKLHEGEHLALVKGELDLSKPVLTRVQAECTFADVFGGSPNKTRNQIHSALKLIGERGCGVLVYIRRSSEGELKLQVDGTGENPISKTPEVVREYGIGSQILLDLGIKKLELLTTAKRNIVGTTNFGVEIVEENLMEVA